MRIWLDIEAQYKFVKLLIFFILKGRGARDYITVKAFNPDDNLHFVIALPATVLYMFD